MDSDRLRTVRAKILREPAVARIMEAVPPDRREDVYLVGGALRDFWLGRALVPDLDFVVAGDVSAFCDVLAERLPARRVVLDEGWGIVRLVVRCGGEALSEPLCLDFSAMQGGQLLSDLSRRDFTCNAVALCLGQAEAGGKDWGWVDPHGGLEDLARGVLRVVRQDAFLEDPLRMLRAFRLGATLGLRLDGETVARIRRDRMEIGRSAGERVRDELLRFFGVDSCWDLLVTMDRCGLLAALFPEVQGLKGLAQGRHHLLDGWAHSLETVRLLEASMRGGLTWSLIRWRDAVRAWLDDEAATRALLKMAALLHDLGKPSCGSRDTRGEPHFYGHERRGAEMVAALTERVRMRRADTQRVRTWVRYHMGPVHMTQAYRRGKLSERARIRFLRRVGPDAPGVLLLSLADVAASRGDGGVAGWRDAHGQTIDSLFRLCVEGGAAGRDVRPLVDGRTLMAELDLPPGPPVGRLLRLLDEARIMGRIRNRNEALALARRIRTTLLPVP